MSKHNRKPRNNSTEVLKQKEYSDRMLLSAEIWIGVLSVSVFAILAAIALLASLEDWITLVLILVGLIPLLVAGPFMLKIEQMAGYYRCDKCGHRHVPEYKRLFWAPHICRTRYMQCPNCQQKSWQKKTLRKKND